MIRLTNFNDLPGLSLVFFLNPFRICFFFHFYNLTLNYWAMSFVICSTFFFVGLSHLISWVAGWLG